MATIIINKFGEDGGYQAAIAEYDGKFSALYALCLYVCQNILHVDYLNKFEKRKVQGRMFLGKSGTHCYYYDGNSTYSAHASDGRLVSDGIYYSKYEYEPNYPKP